MKAGGRQFESNYRQILYDLPLYCQLYQKDENERKRGREWPILKDETVLSLSTFFN